MGLLDRIFGDSESRDENYECRSCKTTFETDRVACDACGGEVVEITPA